MNTRFDRAAAAWDNPERIKRAELIAGEIAKSATLGCGMRVLEFGCGTALISRCLIPEISSLTLVDISSQMLQQAKTRIEESGHPLNLAATQDTGTVETASIDFAYTSMALHHIRDIAHCAREFGRIIKPGGTVCIVDLMPEDGSFHGEDESFDGHFGFDPVQLSSHFHAAGFEKPQHRVIYSGKKPLGDKQVDYSLFLLSMKRV